MAALRAALLCRWAVTSHWAGQWTGGVGWELGWIIGEGRGEEGGCDWEGESAPREEGNPSPPSLITSEEQKNFVADSVSTVPPVRRERKANATNFS